MTWNEWQFSMKGSSSRACLAALLAALAWPVLAAQTEVLPLSGMGEPGEATVYWDFRIDAGRGAGEWSRIRVPSCWEQEGFGTYYYGTQGRHRPDDDPIIPKERGEYRTEFSVPAHWRDRHVRLVFEGVMTDTTVRVNGQQAGATHRGGFYRFHYDITDLVRFGVDNRLEVTVAKESANQSVNHAERRGDYWTFGGIYRPVWLEARPADHIEWTAIDARADGNFYAQVHLARPAPAGSTVRATIVDASETPAGPALAAPVAIHGTTAVITGKIPDVLAWTAETPHLYRVRFTLESGGRVLHEAVERFGFRTFEVRPRDGLYLNGRKIVLKGINRHSFAPATGRTLTREQNYRDARLIKEANMNAVRMAHYPPDKHFLEAADELGLYVLNELAGWQGFYDTPTGARLIGQMVRRDVNHPSILFWNNGNEGGWNRENDGEFDRWDPQRRPVLHPWDMHSGVNTDHYEDYASTQALSRGPDIFMPTEFLHGLYDGGIGAGLRDYWDVMGRSPTVGGAFFWAFADEGIERTDRERRIDNMGNAAPDGMLGPYGEKEGSFYAVKEIWSPVQVSALRMDSRRSSLRMMLRNDHAFTDLSQCTFAWRAVQLPSAVGSAEERSVLATGELRGPALEPGGEREWELPLVAAGIEQADVLHLTAKGPDGSELWTWSVPLATVASEPRAGKPLRTTTASTDGDAAIVRSGPYELRFDRGSGQLVGLRKDGVSFPFSGPQPVAYQRVEREFRPISAPAGLRALRLASAGARPSALATASYDGVLRKVEWSVAGDVLTMSYEIAHQGPVDILGIGFGVPESQVKSKRWVGKGPYRVWQNRLEGGIFDVHETLYNDPVPGQSYAYPEFKGYFADWRWATLETAAGSVTARNESGLPYFGLYRPRGGENPVLELPDVGWSFLHVIPAMGTKFDLPEALGPQSQPGVVYGVQRGRISFRFEPRAANDESPPSSAGAEGTHD